MTARFIVADVFDGLATLEDGSVDLVVTSPPFLALRSYLPADHPDKGKEIGSEPTPAEFIDVMLRVVAELRRVLAPHGSIAIEIGDTYADSGGPGGDYGPGGWREGQPKWERPQKRHEGNKAVEAGAGGGGRPRPVGPGWPLAKSKALIPQLLEVALAYGINPLTGAESPAGRWRVRNVVTWARPNPPVGALGDKWRPATSDVIVACVSDKRYWDDLATRKLAKFEGDPRHDRAGNPNTNSRQDDGAKRYPMPGGAPLLDYWEIPPGGYKGSHYAVFPPRLVEPLIKAMAPPRVCRTCGEPSRRLLTKQATWLRQPELAAHIKERREALGLTSAEINGWFGYKEIAKNWERTDEFGARVPDAKDWPLLKERLGLSDDFDSFIVDRTHSLVEYEHVSDHPSGTTQDATGRIYNRLPARKNRIEPDAGWSDCGHDDWRPAVVLDPFVGSGTTLEVAVKHGHDAVGFDLDERNVELARERVGDSLFHSLEVVL